MKGSIPLTTLLQRVCAFLEWGPPCALQHTTAAPCTLAELVTQRRRLDDPSFANPGFSGLKDTPQRDEGHCLAAQSPQGPVCMREGSGAQATPKRSAHLDKGWCSTWGAGHFSTFDRHMYDFLGTCNYIFAASCQDASPTFSIQLRRGPDGNISRIIMELGASVVTVNEGTTSIKDVGVISLPYTGNGLQVMPFGQGVQLVAKQLELELEVLWGPDAHLMVRTGPGTEVSGLYSWAGVLGHKEPQCPAVPTHPQVLVERKYMGQVCGLCGNFDGKDTNEFLSEDGELLELHKYAALQKLDDPNEICVYQAIPSPAVLQDQHAGICAQLLTLVSSECDVPKEPFVRSCQADMATCAHPDQHNCSCATLSEYSRQCSMDDEPVSSWRGPSLCSVGQCPATQVYQECGAACAKTCSNPQHSCSSFCTFGCFCPEGTVLNDLSKNHTCVPVAQCPCMLNGAVYAPGEVTMAACQTCRCTMGRWTCTERPCPGHCSLEGGSFVTTFDARPYRFHGTCTYILLQSPQLPHEGTLMAVYGKSGYSHSETSLVAVIYLSSEDKIMISQDGVITDNGDTKWLPYKTGSITVFRQTSTHLQMATTFGLELVIQLQPIFQVYITVGPQFRDQTRGLCGNFNGDTTDDFTTSVGITEGTASLFVDSWRAGNCPAALERETDPCSMSQLNKVCSETHCSVLLKKDAVFEKCHATVDPKPFYKRCVYQACNYEETFPHICAALGDYARACSLRGVLLWGWRNSVDNCTIPCTGNCTFSYNSQACDRTCLSLSHPEAECHPSAVPVDGCNCPDGTYLDHRDECVLKAQCPCVLEDGKLILPQQSTVVKGVICYCINGQLSCRGQPQTLLASCSAPKTFQSCGQSSENKFAAACAPTCQMLATGITCVPTKCEPGCVCAKGLYENAHGQCVPPEECPCEFAGVSYPGGAELHTDCKTCTCSRGKWTCLQSAHCPSTCTLYGEGHVVTFDGQRFVFDGTCEYILATDGCGANNSQSTFKIMTENVICGKLGVTCSRAIKIFLGGLSIMLASRNYTVSGEDPRVQFQVKPGSLNLVLDISIPGKYSLTLIWNRHMTLFIKVTRTSQDALCGLCGNHNGNMKDDFETRSKYVASSELEFVNSWKESPLCGDVSFVAEPCSLNAFRRSWAERKCGIINSQTFATCHSKVYRMPYYEACVRDTCGCDEGGDCECLCDAVAAYAKACLDKGVCVDWRAPDFCPIYCDFYNTHTRVGSGQYQYVQEANCTWHYQPCLCPGQLLSIPDTNMEGCYNCSQDEYFDHDAGTCVPCELPQTTTTVTPRTKLLPTPTAMLRSTATGPTVTQAMTQPTAPSPGLATKSTAQSMARTTEAPPAPPAAENTPSPGNPTPRNDLDDTAQRKTYYPCQHSCSNNTSSWPHHHAHGNSNKESNNSKHGVLDQNPKNPIRHHVPNHSVCPQFSLHHRAPLQNVLQDHHQPANPMARTDLPRPSRSAIFYLLGHSNLAPGPQPQQPSDGLVRLHPNINRHHFSNNNINGHRTHSHSRTSSVSTTPHTTGPPSTNSFKTTTSQPTPSQAQTSLAPHVLPFSTSSVTPTSHTILSPSSPAMASSASTPTSTGTISPTTLTGTGPTHTVEPVTRTTSGTIQTHTSVGTVTTSSPLVSHPSYTPHHESTSAFATVVTPKSSSTTGTPEVHTSSLTPSTPHTLLTTHSRPTGSVSTTPHTTGPPSMTSFKTTTSQPTPSHAQTSLAPHVLPFSTSSVTPTSHTILSPSSPAMASSASTPTSTGTISPTTTLTGTGPTHTAEPVTRTTSGTSQAHTSVGTVTTSSSLVSHPSYTPHHESTSTSTTTITPNTTNTTGTPVVHTTSHTPSTPYTSFTTHSRPTGSVSTTPHTTGPPSTNSFKTTTSQPTPSQAQTSLAPHVLPFSTSSVTPTSHTILSPSSPAMASSASTPTSTGTISPTTTLTGTGPTHTVEPVTRTTSGTIQAHTSVGTVTTSSPLVSHPSYTPHHESTSAFATVVTPKSSSTTGTPEPQQPSDGLFRLHTNINRDHSFNKNVNGLCLNHSTYHRTSLYDILQDYHQPANPITRTDIPCHSRSAIFYLLGHSNFSPGPQPQQPSDGLFRLHPNINRDHSFNKNVNGTSLYDILQDYHQPANPIARTDLPCPSPSTILYLLGHSNFAPGPQPQQPSDGLFRLHPNINRDHSFNKNINGTSLYDILQDYHQPANPIARTDLPRPSPSTIFYLLGHSNFAPGPQPKQPSDGLFCLHPNINRDHSFNKNVNGHRTHTHSRTTQSPTLPFSTQPTNISHPASLPTFPSSLAASTPIRASLSPLVTLSTPHFASPSMPPVHVSLTPFTVAVSSTTGPLSTPRTTSSVPISSVFSSQSTASRFTSVTSRVPTPGLASSTLGVTAIPSSPATNLTTRHPGTTQLPTTVFLTSPFRESSSTEGPTVSLGTSALSSPGVCSVQEQEEKITYKGCTVNVTLTRCEGVCASSASFNINTQQVDAQCSCCHPLSSHEKQLKLPCQDPSVPGQWLELTLQVFRSCVCSPQRSVLAAPFLVTGMAWEEPSDMAHLGTCGERECQAGALTTHTPEDPDQAEQTLCSSRWPEAEVKALVWADPLLQLGSSDSGRQGVDDGACALPTSQVLTTAVCLRQSQSLISDMRPRYGQRDNTGAEPTGAARGSSISSPPWHLHFLTKHKEAALLHPYLQQRLDRCRPTALSLTPDPG
ncbi:mucin-6 [Cynocephalus volans]|uniref:mucin-6 n=1 Tax=Cynocephalus volans TaxID=110931 RepID=UPI002FC6E054